MIRQEMEIRHGQEVIIPIHNLQIPEVGCFSEAVVGEAAATHLGWRVVSPWSCVHYLSSKLYHARVASQMAEQEVRPVPDEQPGPELEPPVPVLWILDEQKHNWLSK